MVELYNNIEITDEIYIVRDFCSALLGRSWIRRLGINLNNLDIITTNVIKQVSPIDDIIRDFRTENRMYPQVLDFTKISCERFPKLY